MEPHEQRQVPCPAFLLAHPSSELSTSYYVPAHPCPSLQRLWLVLFHFHLQGSLPGLRCLALKAALGILSKGLIDSNESIHSHHWGKLDCRVGEGVSQIRDSYVLPSLYPIISVSVPHPLLFSSPTKVSDQACLRFHYLILFLISRSHLLSNYLAKYWAGLCGRGTQTGPGHVR